MRTASSVYLSDRSSFRSPGSCLWSGHRTSRNAWALIRIRAHVRALATALGPALTVGIARHVDQLVARPFSTMPAVGRKSIGTCRLHNPHAHAIVVFASVRGSRGPAKTQLPVRAGRQHWRPPGGIGAARKRTSYRLVGSGLTRDRASSRALTIFTVSNLTNAGRISTGKGWTSH